MPRAPSRRPMRGRAAMWRPADMAASSAQPAMTARPFFTICRPRATLGGPRSTSPRCRPQVTGVRREGSRIETVPVAIKEADGALLDTAIPKVAIAKDASYWDDDSPPDPEAEVDLIAMIGHMLKSAPLAGFVVEGFTPYGRPRLNCAAPADAARRAQRTSGRARRARQHRGLRAAARPRTSSAART